jgi:hypothetical protein
MQKIIVGACEVLSAAYQVLSTPYLIQGAALVTATSEL